jgi:hypothetical protein
MTYYEDEGGQFPDTLRCNSYSLKRSNRGHGAVMQQLGEAAAEKGRDLAGGKVDGEPAIRPAVVDAILAVAAIDVSVFSSTRRLNVSLKLPPVTLS